MIDITKKALIERLLKEGKISKDDAIVLGRPAIPQTFPRMPLHPMPLPTETPYMPVYPVPFQQFPNMVQEWPQPSDYAKLCPCNPENGGSGICNCIMSGPKVTC